MTSLSSSASTSAKTVNNNAQKNISVSVCEKNALTAVNGRKKRKQGRLRDFCIVFLSVVIAFCTGIMLFCGYAMTQRNQNRPNRPSTEVQTSLTVTKIKPVPRIISVSVAEELNADFTRNVAIECRNDDGTTDGLYYSYNGDSDRKRLEGGKAVLALPKGSYIITVTNDSGKAVQSDEFTINVDAVTKITIDKTDTYMNVGMTGTLTTAFETIGNPTDSEKSVKWNSSAPKTVSVKDGVITALKAGTATITASVSDSISDSIEITVTDLLRAPKITATKPLLQPGQYSEAEGSMIDAVLESRVNTAGYVTRAGVVAAARFIPLEFNYKIPYFYENGRLDPQPERPYCDGEGRFYHKGLYLTHSKFDILDKKGILFGPATWGEPLTNWEDAFGLIPGAKYANGMTCSGFVSWCLYNGGVPLGDVGAGDTPGYDDEYSDFGERVWLDEEVMRSGILQVGDLIGCDGHIAIIAGFDENNIYIAEALGKGIVMEVRERYREVWQCGDYTYAMLMGDIYAKHNGKGNVTEMWKDYSAENNQ